MGTNVLCAQRLQQDRLQLNPKNSFSVSANQGYLWKSELLVTASGRQSWLAVGEGCRWRTPPQLGDQIRPSLQSSSVSRCYNNNNNNNPVAFWTLLGIDPYITSFYFSQPKRWTIGTEEINQIFLDSKILSCADMAIRPGVPTWDLANSTQ